MRIKCSPRQRNGIGDFVIKESTALFRSNISLRYWPARLFRLCGVGAGALLAVGPVAWSDLATPQAILGMLVAMAAAATTGRGEGHVNIKPPAI